MAYSIINAIAGGPYLMLYADEKVMNNDDLGFMFLVCTFQC